MRHRYPLIIAIVSLSAVALLLAVVLPSVASEPAASGSDECGYAFQISEGLPAVEPVVHIVLAPHVWVERSHFPQDEVPRALPIVKTVSPRSPPVIS